ncbi:MAG: UDP-N-acetylmuramoyl-L-alanyl-D-glutamate--2,6-diaminopimelate ligase, partial [Geminicoccaceae bacterium]|nr:UDP-N-acetylmuramoyl-L-alanyl-D-glutamate--2,6-diaminopimelate ligase [Geminicoccaceae bacterium]
MRLSALLTPDALVAGADPEAVEIAALTADSRKVEPGALFAALEGGRTDGRAFVGDALQRGAVAVLAAGPVAEAAGRAVLVVDPDPRQRLARMAARFFGRQPRRVVAVTGTNGKTTVASLVAQMWRHAGQPAASLGTLGIDAGEWQEAGALTTPDPVELHRCLSRLASRGIDHLALEASSHGLEQRRLDGVEFAAAAFTNLSRDHLDYHGDEDTYFRAKARLFDTLLEPGHMAVLPRDRPEFDRLSEVCRRRGIEVCDYGRTARRIRLTGQRAEGQAQRLDLAIDGERHTVRLQMAGDFQAENLMAALGLVLATGTSASAALAAVDRLRAPPGRMQEVARTADGAPIVVDYAHTPEALQRVLAALRPTTEGRLIVVFGCGGDRDPGKRRLMGTVAAAGADRVIITDDNPRTEDPKAIRRAVLAAVPEALDIGDRRAAIRRAVEGLKAGDTLLIAGKGHERVQIVG